MTKKIFVAAVTVLMLLSVGVSGYASEVNVSDISGTQAAINLDGTKIDMGAYIQDSTVYLPVRAVCQALGYTVQWSQENNEKVVTTIKGDRSVAIYLDNQTIINNGHTCYMMGTYAGKGCIMHQKNTYLASEVFWENFGVDVQFDDNSKTVTISRLNENEISITTMKLNSEDENLKETIQYPQIDGLDDIEVQSSINCILSHAATNAVEEGLQNAYEIIKAKQQYPDYTAKCETYFDYRITYNQNRLLSVVLYDYQYAGGAHGGTVQTSYTFDLTTGNVLKISDLMKSDSSYVSYMNSTIRTEIDKRVASGEVSQFEDNKFKTIEDNPDYYLANGAVVIYFQQYQYFPYAAGIQEFSIKFSGFENMLNNKYRFLYTEPTTLEQGVQNEIALGNLACVTLAGNPTTGYDWHCIIGDSSILTQTSENYTSDSNLIGAGGVYAWQFKALKAGQTTITFKYYRDWEGEASATAENIIVYRVIVK